MQIADLDRILHDLVSHFVRLAVCNSGLDAAAGEPDCEGAGIVISSHVLHLLAISILPHRRPAEFASPHYECILQHAALLQIRQQRRYWLIDFPTPIGKTEVQCFFGVCPMRIPSPVIELDKSHATFRQPPCDQAIVGETGLAGLRSVHRPNGVGFFMNVHSIGGIDLHTERHLVLRDSRDGFRVSERRISLLVDLVDGV